MEVEREAEPGLKRFRIAEKPSTAAQVPTKRQETFPQNHSIQHWLLLLLLLLVLTTLRKITISV